MGNGLKNQFKEFFEDDATNMIMIATGRTTKPYKGYKENRQIQFKNDDLELLKSEFGDKIEYISSRIYKKFRCKTKMNPEITV
ncbi:MAG: hypothetical protein U5K51_15585 [Flavobacteriaceae bacterium]|nr:hypothetical protein [Flavobacteriaceae bacterium]